MAAVETAERVETTGVIPAMPDEEPRESTAVVRAMETTGVVPAMPDTPEMPPVVPALPPLPELPAQSTKPLGMPPPALPSAPAPLIPEPPPIEALAPPSRPSPPPIDIFALPEDAPPPPASSIELAALRQEFSVVARLESSSRKKRWLWIGVVAAMAATIALVVILVGSDPPAGTLITSDNAQTTRKPFSAEKQRAPVANAQDPVAPAPVPEPTPPTPATETAKTELKKGEPKPRQPFVVPSVDPSKVEMTKERFDALTVDESGKSETRIVFDPGAASRDKVAEEAAAKKAAVADALAEEVAMAFGKKKSQFAKCSDSNQERVKVLFTVTATGKTTGTSIDGTNSVDKVRCIKAILDRSVFPAGDSALTYSQTLVL